MSYAEYSPSQSYTKLSESAKEKLEKFFNVLHSREEVEDLINEFIWLEQDGRGDVERKIARILSGYDKCGYAGKHGSRTICTDRTDEKAVLAAADKYRKFAGYLPNTAELDDMFYTEVLEVYKDYKSSSDYIERLVKRRMKALSPELIKEGDGTRLLIFKQFLKAAEFPKTTCLSRELRDYICELTDLPEKTSKTEIENAIASLTDSVFEKLDEISAMLEDMKKDKTVSKDKYKDTQKSYNKKWEPLMWADDISRSSFNDQRTTRLKLYWFAIIFEMTYYSGAFNEAEDETTDIQKKLFYEFYADNLLNNLLEPDAALEKEPTGHGINFKNFAEVIYLYYIHRNDLQPGQKLSKAKSMINKCKESKEENINIQAAKHGNKNTLFYEPLISQVMNLPEDKIQEFISENYICGKKGVNIIRTASENMIAADIYKSMVNELVRTAELTADHESISHEHIYHVMEAQYYLKERCSKCEYAREQKLYEKCALHQSECMDAYDKYKENFDKEKSDDAQEPKKREQFYLDKCASCWTAYKSRYFEQCPLFESKCKDKYREYREKKLTLAEEREKKIEITNRIIKDKALAILNSASCLFTQIPEQLGDDSLEMLLSKISKKFHITENRKTLEQCVKSSFLPAGDVESYVTRTKMIVLYYYIFMLQSINEYFECGSFADFYEEFCENFELILGGSGTGGTQVYLGINDCLVESGYQEINTKNIFDILVLFFAFKNYRKIRNIGIEKGDEQN